LPRKARKPAYLPKSDGDAGVQTYIASTSQPLRWGHCNSATSL
jgi:hypothetical protein